MIYYELSAWLDLLLCLGSGRRWGEGQTVGHSNNGSWRHVSLVGQAGLHWLSMLYSTAEAIHELPDAVKLILFFTRTKPTGGRRIVANLPTFYASTRGLGLKR